MSCVLSLKLVAKWILHGFTSIYAYSTQLFISDRISNYKFIDFALKMHFRMMQGISINSFFRFESEKKKSTYDSSKKKKHFKILEYQAFILNMEFHLENQKKKSQKYKWANVKLMPLNNIRHVVAVVSFSHLQHHWIIIYPNMCIFKRAKKKRIGGDETNEIIRALNIHL